MPATNNLQDTLQGRKRKKQDYNGLPMVGQTFGRLTVVGEGEGDGWLCSCICGGTTTSTRKRLYTGNTRSCGCILKEQAALRARSRAYDFTGQRRGKLLILGRIEGKPTKWLCKCDCGKEKVVQSSHLNAGTQSCGCMVGVLNSSRLKGTGRDLTGERFGLLVVTGRGGYLPVGSHGKEVAAWLCLCECGAQKTVRGCELKSKSGTRSCGASHHSASWKGGRHKDSQGYIKVLAKGHPHAGKNGYAREHLVVMAEHIGRPIRTEVGEQVHHRNTRRDDNRLCNLELKTGAHGTGGTVVDMVADAVEFLREYAPHLLASGVTAESARAWAVPKYRPEEDAEA